MRTTIDLPQSVHDQLRRRALDRRMSMSRLAAELLEEGLAGPRTAPTLGAAGPGGLRTVTVGRPIDADDVAELEDEW